MSHLEDLQTALRYKIPLRVDFAGGWLDVPKFARRGAFIVNCAVDLLYRPFSVQSYMDPDMIWNRPRGMGGSAAWRLENRLAALDWNDAVRMATLDELEAGCGWQDPACIGEGGLCVWESGPLPRLHQKQPGGFLRGRMALFNTRVEHDTPGLVDIPRDYDAIAAAASTAEAAVNAHDIHKLQSAVRASYDVQLAEGMPDIWSEFRLFEAIKGANGDTCDVAFKYCGGGHGGVILVLWPSPEKRVKPTKPGPWRLIEPYNHISFG